MKSVNEENIRMVRLAQSPEEFVCEVMIMGDLIVCKNPMVLVAKESQFGLAPWSPFSTKRSFEFTKDKILYANPTFQSVVDAYIHEITGVEVVRNVDQLILPEGVK